MRRFVKLGALCLLCVGGSPALAADYVDLSDLIFYYRPEQTRYRPDHIDATDGDTGQNVTLVCSITHSGHLADCEPEGESDVETGFVRAAIRNVESWIVADYTRSGNPTEGRQVSVTVRFDLAV
jgi:hypothetical protein